MSDSLIDANVPLDIATADPVWMPWSRTQIHEAAQRGAMLVNPIIYAELAPAFSSSAALKEWLDPALFVRAPLPYGAAWLAAQAFVTYRRSGGQRSAPMPDFFASARTHPFRSLRLSRVTLRDTEATSRT